MSDNNGQNKLDMVGRMAANTDPDKRKAFMQGFSGKTEPKPSQHEGMLAAMKRKLVGGS